MINAGIFSGDYVLVQSTNTAENGDIVVALLDDEATIKRFYKETDYIRLQPENPSMAPIIVKDLKYSVKSLDFLGECNFFFYLYYHK